MQSFFRDHIGVCWVMIGCLLFMSSQIRAQASQLWALDVKSPESITSAVLDVISGPQGEKRDWDRFRNLFRKEATMNVVFYRNDTSKIASYDIETFITRAGPWYENHGFEEHVGKVHVDRFGNIAQVFQSYEAIFPSDHKIERGVNCYQLVFADNRWWIVSLIYDTVSSTRVLPRKLKFKPKR